LPDVFQEHGKPNVMYDNAGLNAAQIMAVVLREVGSKQPAVGRKKSA